MNRTRQRPNVEQLVGVLIPAVIVRPRPPTEPLPVLPSPRLPDETRLLIDAVRVDPSGRIWATTLLRALCWETGHRVGIDVCDHVLVIRAAADAAHAVGARGSLALPAPVRRMGGIVTGSTVLLLAAADTPTILVCPVTIAATYLAALFNDVAGEPA